jgi:hypothetical protein
MTASPMSKGCSHSTSATSPKRTVPPFFDATGTRARSSGVTPGETGRMYILWFGVSMNPTICVLAELECASSPKFKASAAVSSTSFSVTPCRRIRSGSTWTCSCFKRSPHMAMFATPGTRIKRKLIFQ